MIKAAVMEAPDKKIVVKEFEKPDMEPGAVLLETIYSEVCGTDCHLFHGKLAGVPYPIIPGHVSVGKIAEMNGDVRDIHGKSFHTGDVVAFLDVHETCGKCWFCLVAKATTRCPHRKVYGITYSAKEGLLGGWSEYIYLKPGVKIIRLPENITPEKYISGGCGMPTAFHAVERATIKLGDTVVIQGSGPVGLNTVIFSRLSGAGKIIVLGAPDLRLELAKEFGADLALDIKKISERQRIEAVKDATEGRGGDVVIEASGNPRAVWEGLQMTRDNGIYVVVGQYTDHGPVEINPHLDINKKHIDIRGCWGCDFSHLYKAIQVMNRHAGDFPWEKSITGFYGLSEAQEALEDVESLKVVKAVIDPRKKG